MFARNNRGAFPLMLFNHDTNLTNQRERSADGVKQTIAVRRAEDSTGLGWSSTFLPCSPLMTPAWARPAHRCCLGSQWFSASETVQIGKPFDLIYSIFALHFIGEETKGTAAPGPHSKAGSYFWGQSCVGGAWEQTLSLTSQALKGTWGGSEGCPGLTWAWGAIQPERIAEFWKNIQPKVEPNSQLQGTDAERLLSLDQCLFPQGVGK